MWADVKKLPKHASDVHVVGTVDDDDVLVVLLVVVVGGVIVLDVDELVVELDELEDVLELVVTGGV